MRGERVLFKMLATADERGELRFDFLDVEVDQAQLSALLQVAADKASPNLDRADEVEAFGAGRRRR